MILWIVIVLTTYKGKFIGLNIRFVFCDKMYIATE